MRKCNNMLCVCCWPRCLAVHPQPGSCRANRLCVKTRRSTKIKSRKNWKHNADSQIIQRKGRKEREYTAVRVAHCRRSIWLGSAYKTADAPVSIAIGCIGTRKSYLPDKGKVTIPLVKRGAIICVPKVGMQHSEACGLNSHALSMSLTPRGYVEDMLGNWNQASYGGQSHDINVYVSRCVNWRLYWPM